MPKLSSFDSFVKKNELDLCMIVSAGLNDHAFDNLEWINDTGFCEVYARVYFGPGSELPVRIDVQEA